MSRDFIKGAYTVLFGIYVVSYVTSLFQGFGTTHTYTWNLSDAIFGILYVGFGIALGYGMGRLWRD